MEWFDRARETVVDWLGYTQDSAAYITKSSWQVVRYLVPVVRLALPVVRAIDTELKPALRTSHLPSAVVLTEFLLKHLPDAREVERWLEIYGRLPWADLLLNVGVVLVRVKASEAMTTSMLRSSVELAYQVYQLYRTLSGGDVSPTDNGDDVEEALDG